MQTHEAYLILHAGGVPDEIPDQPIPEIPDDQVPHPDEVPPIKEPPDLPPNQPEMPPIKEPPTMPPSS